jgi:hypothetical protein
MVTKCANPSCENSFRYFRGGSLFLVEPQFLSPARDAQFHEDALRREYFWLCEKCAPEMTVARDQNGHPHVRFRDHNYWRAS